jgi:hypothetical protein
MSNPMHPAAPHHLPFFLPQPDGSDPVMMGTGIFLVGAVLTFGVVFLRLHTLPERLAHRGHKLQFQVVAVLGLLALFTHVHLFWVAGLLLALVDFPDFTGPMRRIAGSTERLAGLPPGAGDMPQDGLPSSSGSRRPPEVLGPGSEQPHVQQPASARMEA